MLMNRQTLGLIVLIISDVVILLLIIFCALVVRAILPYIISGYPAFSIEIIYTWWFFPLWIAIMAYEGAYTKKFTFWDDIKLLWKSTLFLTCLILTILFLSKASEQISRTAVVLIGIFSLALLPILRIPLKRLLISIGLLKSKVLVIGANEMSRLAYHTLLRDPNLGYEVVGFIDDGRTTKRETIDEIKVHRGLDRAERYIRNCDIQDVIIALPEYDKKKLYSLINRLQHKVRSILLFPDMTGLAVSGTEVRHFFHDQTFALEIKNNLVQPFNYVLKRLIDFLIAIILFMLFFIPIGIIALLIRINSKGPAIFLQERIGRNCKPFMCYKFRTMYVDAEERLTNLLNSDPETKKEWKTHWKLKNDPRITPIGNFLRKTSFDELPQLFNVLKREMSIVGPRPYLPREWDALKTHSHIIHSVHPGITGLWQVSGRSDSSNEQRLSLDSWYVRNWSLWLDIVIILKTVKVVLKKEGAR
jgi:Undecaprenyl-phosphate galactose phosphotransferase WbaP